MAMEQRARFHPNATPGIKAAQKVYAKFIEEMKKKTKSRKNPPQVYYHGSPVDNIKVLRKGSYVSPDYQTAYDMGRYHLDTKKSWTDEDLAIPMDWGTRPTFKKGREPKGIPTVYTVELYDDDLVELGVDEDGVNWEYQTSIEAPVVKKNPSDCPPATQDLELNTKNRDSAVKAEHIQYGPLNLSDEDYWVRYGERWNTTAEVAKKSNCSNCVAFDISPRMEECMPLQLDKDGRLGYCWMHHFKCHSARTCYTWAKGGPITDDEQSMENQQRAFPKSNPKKTPEGRKIPKRYLKGLNKEEMLIAAKEIDKGYKYDIDDPKAYEYWKSDIKATARGYKTVPSKYKKKFIEMYGPLPEKGKFLDKMAKATKIKKSILQKVYDKGLAAWRGGHRPGVQQHQWAAGRVYSFVTLGNTVKKGNKKMPDYKLAVEAGLVKDNPSEADFFPGDAKVAPYYMRAQTIPITALQNGGEWRHGEFAEDDPFEEYFEE